MRTWIVRFLATFIGCLLVVVVFPGVVEAAPAITGIQTNTSQYPNNSVPRYQKLEVTFNLSTVATNLYFPFDQNPPTGIQPSLGVSVQAQFTAPDGQVYQQPAFLFQQFDDQVRNDRDWFYPLNTYVWKARFSPHQTGTWQFRLTAQDSSGTAQTTLQSFSVTDSASHGFVKVAANDPRYFEYDDGTYFPALGYNLNGGELDNVRSVTGNMEEFETMGENGIQLSRVWLSQFSIFGEAYGKWTSPNRVYQTQEPRLGIVAPNNWQFAATYPGFTPPALAPGSEYYLWLEFNETVASDGTQQRFTPCRFLQKLAVKQNTSYRVRVRYKSMGIEGPKVAGLPYGFAVKTASSSIANATSTCNEPTAGTVVTATYTPNAVTTDAEGWSILTGSFNSGATDFINEFYLTFINVKSQDSDLVGGHVFVDRVWLEEAACSTNCPNLITKPSMDMHRYISQRDAYSLDKVLQLAEQKGVYFKAVMMEKNDRILQTIDFNGNTVSTPTINNFYGNRRQVTKVRWLQQAWWRYMQGRWGYSPNIHSWEMLNEGHPGNTEGHWDMVDEFGKYMHCRVFGVQVSSANPYEDCQYDHPNDHLVSTSFFNSSFPWQFWNNQQSGQPLTYAEMDYVDQHYYANVDDTSVLASYYDSAQFSNNLSTLSGNFAPGKRKPFMRGEAGWDFEGDDVLARNADNGEWLHDYIWAGLNHGGLMEHYFAGATFTKHIYDLRATPPHDHRHMFKPYYDFIKNIPLNNGHYQDAAAAVSAPTLRAWGQKDTLLGRAHVWIANKNHTWYNAMGGYVGGPPSVTIVPISGTVSVGGFAPNTAYPITWWNTYTGVIDASRGDPDSTAPSDSSGTITLSVSNLTNDVAVRIGDYGQTNSLAGDADGDGDVDLQDYNTVLSHFGQIGQAGSIPMNQGDLDQNGRVDLQDYNQVVSNFGMQL